MRACFAPVFWVKISALWAMGSRPAGSIVDDGRTAKEVLTVPAAGEGPKQNDKKDTTVRMPSRALSFCSIFATVVCPVRQQ
jgi:hypothetical protein